MRRTWLRIEYVCIYIYVYIFQGLEGEEEEEEREGWRSPTFGEGGKLFLEGGLLRS
jgi:hypothetical protein